MKRWYRVEVRYPPPADNTLQVAEFPTEEEAFSYANKVVQLAERIIASGSKDAKTGGEIGIFKVGEEQVFGLAGQSGQRRHLIAERLPDDLWLKREGNTA